MTIEPHDPLVKGQRIDRYEIREHIGKGGMGAVYRAIDSKLGRTVALKTVVAHRRGQKMTEEIRERFMREALAASRVDHRNVVQVLDFGFADDGTPYMVMEHLRGQSLSAILKSSPAPLAIDYVVDIMLSVCAALRACHHVGIIHRDLKPANIFLCDTDTGWEVKVLDFGISKAPAAADLTQEGQIIGTPQYLSPEQIEGTVGPEIDQYALGVLLYASLTGCLPYASYQSTRLLRAISEATFDPPRTIRPDLPEALEAIVLRAMHVSPMQRFESIHALGQQLWDFASARGRAQWKAFYFHTPVPAPPAAPPISALVPAPARLRGSERGCRSTASLAAVAAFVKVAAAEVTIGASHFALTRTAAESGVDESISVSLSDIAGESALSDASNSAGAGRARRWLAAVALAGAASVAVVTLVRPSAAHQPVAPSSAPAASRPTPVPAAAKRPTIPRAAIVAPTAPPPIAKPAPPATRSRKRLATRRHKSPKTDQHGIGIPAE